MRSKVSLTPKGTKPSAGERSSDLDRRGEKLQESKLFGGWTK